MPMNRALYPKNWEAIALAIKTEVNWTCENCGRPCRRPNETNSQLRDRLEEEHPWWAWDIYDVEEDPNLGPIGVEKFKRFCLTVAHLDHVPQNCDRTNLRALCAPCHCRYDLRAMATKRRLKQEREGQLNLLVGVENA